MAVYNLNVNTKKHRVDVDSDTLTFDFYQIG